MKYKQLLFVFMLTAYCISLDASNSDDKWWSSISSVFFEKTVCLNDDINCRFGLGWTRLHSVTILEKTLAVKEYLDNPEVDVNIRDSNGKTPMHYAVESGNVSIIILLKRSKASFKIRDNHGKFPLDYASEEAKQKLINLKVIV